MREGEKRWEERVREGEETREEEGREGERRGEELHEERNGGRKLGVRKRKKEKRKGR